MNTSLCYDKNDIVHLWMLRLNRVVGICKICLREFLIDVNMLPVMEMSFAHFAMPTLLYKKVIVIACHIGFVRVVVKC